MKARAGGDNGFLEAKFLAGLKVYGFPAGVHARGRCSEFHSDLVLPIKALGIDSNPFFGFLACEKSFREGRPLVRKRGILRENREFAGFQPALHQFLGTVARHHAATEDDILLRVHDSPPSEPRHKHRASWRGLQAACPWTRRRAAHLLPATAP